MSSVEQQALALLEAGRARIAKGWCQGAYARDASGQSVNPDAPEAASWCAWGAADLPGDAEGYAYAALVDARGGLPAPPDLFFLLSTWNDHPDRTQDEVLALYDKAIADLRAQLEASDG